MSFHSVQRREAFHYVEGCGHARTILACWHVGLRIESAWDKVSPEFTSMFKLLDRQRSIRIRDHHHYVNRVLKKSKSLALAVMIAHHLA